MSSMKKEEIRGYGIYLVIEVGLARWCSKKQLAFPGNPSSVK